MNATATKTDRRNEFLEAAKAHYAADMLIKGTYADEEAENFKGCSVGCFLHSAFPKKSVTAISEMSNKHALVAKHYGYPEWLALLQDTVFEGLPNGESAKWHVQLAESIAALPADVDWGLVLHRVHVGILRVSYQTAGTAQEAVKAVLDLHERAANGDVVSDELWSAAWRAAESAARSAAWRAAESAAESAAWGAARSAAWSAAYQEMRDAILAALAA
jgi:hypothetical protein